MIPDTEEKKHETPVEETKETTSENAGNVTPPETPAETPKNNSTAAAVEHLVAQNQELIKTLDETRKLMETQRKSFEKDLTEMREGFDHVRASLPQRSVDEKAEVTGYYDFDIMGNKLLSEEAKSDKEQAFKDLSLLAATFR